MKDPIIPTNLFRVKVKATFGKRLTLNLLYFVTANHQIIYFEIQYHPNFAQIFSEKIPKIIILGFKIILILMYYFTTKISQLAHF